jgi:methionyl-tRNA synthetase
LGNLVSRTVAMAQKYFGGTLKKGLAPEEDPDGEFKATVCGTVKKVVEKADTLHIADAIGEIFTLLRRANKYIDETMPWALAKDESKQARLNDVLYNLTEAIVIGASLLSPFMPETSEKMLAAFGAKERTLEECAQFALAEEVVTSAVSPLFARLDFKTLQPKIDEIKRLQVEAYLKENPELAPQKEEKKEEKKVEEVKEEELISIDDFAKVRLQVGEIIACEKVEKSSKLLHETVKFGEEIRSVVSGIAKHYSPEEMVGKKVVFVTNLKPVKICGVLSEGMILAAEDEGGRLALVVSDKADLKSGANIG